MKPISLDINASCSGANKNYGVLITQENIQDVMENSDYLDANRDLIISQFTALALYECSKLIFNDIQRRLIDGAAPTSNN